MPRSIEKKNATKKNASIDKKKKNARFSDSLTRKECQIPKFPILEETVLEEQHKYRSTIEERNAKHC